METETARTLPSQVCMCVARTFSEPFDELTLSGGKERRVPSRRDRHALELDAAIRGLNADSARGLTTSEVEERQLRYASNAIQEIRPRPAWRRFVGQTFRHFARKVQTGIGTFWNSLPE